MITALHVQMESEQKILNFSYAPKGFWLTNSYCSKGGNGNIQLYWKIEQRYSHIHWKHFVIQAWSRIPMEPPYETLDILGRE